MHEILMNKEHLTLKYLNYNLRSGDWQACISLKQSGIELHFKNNQDITSDPHFSSSLLTRIMTRSRINLLTIQLEKPAPVLLHSLEKLNSWTYSIHLSSKSSFDSKFTVLFSSKPFNRIKSCIWKNKSGSCDIVTWISNILEADESKWSLSKKNAFKIVEVFVFDTPFYRNIVWLK